MRDRVCVWSFCLVLGSSVVASGAESNGPPQAGSQADSQAGSGAERAPSESLASRAPDDGAAVAPRRGMLRADCRAELAPQKLSGPALREAVSACIVRKRPDLAEREQCRMLGFHQGLRQAGLRVFVQDCLKSKG